MEARLRASSAARHAAVATWFPLKGGGGDGCRSTIKLVATSVLHCADQEADLGMIFIALELCADRVEDTLVRSLAVLAGVFHARGGGVVFSGSVATNPLRTRRLAFDKTEKAVAIIFFLLVTTIFSVILMSCAKRQPRSLRLPQ